MQSAKFKIGRIQTAHSFIDVWLVIEDGVGVVHLHASECGKDRQALLILTRSLWQQLKDLIQETDATIEKLKATGQLRYVAEGFQLAE